jgi:hypothetical protein
MRSDGDTEPISRVKKDWACENPSRRNRCRKSSPGDAESFRDSKQTLCVNAVMEHEKDYTYRGWSLWTCLCNGRLRTFYDLTIYSRSLYNGNLWGYSRLRGTLGLSISVLFRIETSLRMRPDVVEIH